MTALRERWPGMPVPKDVLRDDGEPLGQVVPTTGGWQAVTVIGAPLGEITSREEAAEMLRAEGLSCLADPWWVRPAGFAVDDIDLSYETPPC